MGNRFDLYMMHIDCRGNVLDHVLIIKQLDKLQVNDRLQKKLET